MTDVLEKYAYIIVDFIWIYELYQEGKFKSNFKVREGVCV